MINKPEVACSLIINVSRGDTPILEYTLPHILNSHAIRFSEVIVVVDKEPAEGRIRQQNLQYSLEELYETLDKIRKSGCEFTQEFVNYNTEDVNRIFSKWFGHSDVSYRCAGGTPIYAFLYGLDNAQYDFRLHLDSDMLIHDPGPKSWVCKAIEILEQIPEVLFVNQTWGVQPKSSPAPDSMPSMDIGFEQRVSQIFSTRCFLFSMEKLRTTFLPIEAKQHPWLKRVVYTLQGRSSYVALEQMITSALNRTNTYRADLNMEWGFNLHAWDKSIFQNPHINGIVRQIEAGHIPPEHLGQHNLNYSLFLRETDRLTKDAAQSNS